VLQREKKRELLSQAIAAHNTYTRDASTGKGCDRHLMGLRLMMREGEKSPLLDDEFFSKSAEWKLSTSGLSAGTRFFGTGYVRLLPAIMRFNSPAPLFLALVPFGQMVME